jgi:hypothetical protein
MNFDFDFLNSLMKGYGMAPNGMEQGRVKDTRMLLCHTK